MAFSSSSLGRTVSLGESSGWPTAFRMPNLPNRQSQDPNHLSSEQTGCFAGNCWSPTRSPRRKGWPAPYRIWLVPLPGRVVLVGYPDGHLDPSAHLYNLHLWQAAATASGSTSCAPAASGPRICPPAIRRTLRARWPARSKQPADTIRSGSSSLRGTRKSPRRLRRSRVGTGCGARLALARAGRATES